MLLNFSFSNVLCFGPEVTFSMVASPDDKHPNHVIHKVAAKRIDLLRTSAIYGANGHGKTRFVEAISFLKTLVVAGTKPLQAIPIVPFKLDPKLRQESSKFEINFHFGDVDYNYGIAVSNHRVIEEWLFVREKTKEVPFFERRTDDHDVVAIETGSSLNRKNSRGFLQYVAQGTRPNQPFLTEAVGKNVKGLDGAYKWFKDVLKVVRPSAEYGALPTRARNESKFLEFISTFLQNSNTGIDEIEVVERPLDFDALPLQFPVNVRAEILDQISAGRGFSVIDDENAGFMIGQSADGSPAVLTLHAIHKDTLGDKVRFDLSEEASGTHRLLQLLPMLVDLAGNNGVYVIDELDRKLHPLLSYRFIEYFLEQFQSNSQLIFTTHNTHLLDLQLLRRDEIWFVEKRLGGASDMYSLINLKVRSDLDIQKGYMKGRFGAVPFVGNLGSLGWLDEAAC